MRHPVTVAETGVTYDRRAIEQWWFVRSQRTCPATQRVVRSLELKPNAKLAADIAAWLGRHQGYVSTLDREDEVQQALFGEVETDAVGVHRSLQALASADAGKRGAALAALCERSGWPELPATLLRTGAYLELVQVSRPGQPPYHHLCC